MVAGGAAAAVATLLLGAGARGQPRPARSALALEGAAIAVCVLAVLGLRPSVPWPAYLDGGWYAAAAAGIARHGGLWFPAAAAAEPAFVATFDDFRAAGMAFPPDTARGFHAVALSAPAPGRPVAAPYHPPLLAAYLAAWAASDPARAAEGVRYWALAWLLGAAGLAAALAGPAAAALAAALLAAGPALRLYGAQPYAEMAAGTLLLLGAHGLLAAARRPGPRPRLAALAGMALGLSVLAKVDAVVGAAAVVGWWAWLRGRRPGMVRAEGRWLAAGLALPALHGVALALGPTAVYVRLNGWGVLELARAHAAWLAAATAIAAGLLLLARRAGGSVPLAAAVGLGIAAALATARDVTPGLASPPTMVGILAHVVTPLGVFAAIAGVAVPPPALRRDAATLVRALLVAVVIVLLAPIVTRTLSPIYVARRLVPVALPVVAALAAAAALDAHRRSGPIGRLLVAGGIVLAVVGAAFAARPILAGREFAGTAGLVARLAAYGEPGDRFVLPSALGGDDAGRLASALWALEAREVAVVGSAGDAADGAAADAVGRWLDAGHGVIWLGAGPPSLPGIAAEQLGREALITQVLVPEPALPPRYERLELDVSVWRLARAPDGAQDTP